MKTKILSTGILASMLLLSGPVFAQTDIGNSDTGKNSENTVDVDTENEINIVTNNEADVDTDISVNANTGGNKIGESNEEKHGEENQSVTTGDATISTGNATAEATVTNAINNTTVTVEQEKENEQNEEEEENEGGQGGGPVVTPTTAAVAEGGLGSGAEVAAVTTSEGGLGAGETTGGLGAGPLAEAGFEGLLPPIILSSIVTFFMALKRKKYTI